MVYATIREHNSFYTPQGPELGATFSTQQEPIKKALYPLKGEKNNIVNKDLFYYIQHSNSVLRGKR